MKRAAGAIAALLVLLAGCENKEADALRADIAKLKQERVEIAVIEKAKQEAADAEAVLAASRSAQADAQTALAKVTAERDALRAAIEAEAARNEKLRAEIDAVARRAQELAAHGQDLDARIAAARERATFVRNQAAVLARELRPEDPAWASSRRMAALAEFAERVARDYPDDPVAAATARAAVRADAPDAAQVRAAAGQAARLRDRFEAVYELPSAEVAARESTPPEEKP